MKKWIAWICLLSISVNARIIFQDTFDTATTDDINAEHAPRQSGGKIKSMYSFIKFPSSYKPASTIVDGQMKRVTGEALTLDANLARYFKDGNFTVSVDITMPNADGTWSGMYIVTNSEKTRDKSVFGFHAWDSGNSSAFIVYGGTDGHQDISIRNNEVSACLGKNYDKTVKHTIQLVSRSKGRDAEGCTFDFVVDGVTVRKGIDYMFGDGKKCNLQFVAVTPADSAVYFDNLTITQD